MPKDQGSILKESCILLYDVLYASGSVTTIPRSTKDNSLRIATRKSFVTIPVPLPSAGQTTPGQASVPQGSLLGPILYLAYTADIHVYPNTHIATFADDTAIYVSNLNPHTVSASIQNHLSDIETWCRL
ncbi:hypothetical protein AAG570_003289 [Ranatra chinensis]|uniref:Reverse transcriptase domain-containing protein n=1 Tax=Ranatra chinensis TaxID=642074 RepID=A0ABD0Y6G5_9HEMI